MVYILFCGFMAQLLVCCSGSSAFDDAPACTAVTAPVLAVLGTTSTPCGEESGAISVVGSGGAGSLTFSIDEQNFQASGIFTDLPTGPHTLIVKDANNCTAELQVTVASGISFQESIFPIIELDCAISGCHVSGAQVPDLTVRSNIFSAATRIKNQVETRNMPRGRCLTSTEIENIICWFNDGSPDN